MLFIDEVIQPEISLIAEEDTNRNHFQVIAQPNSRTYDASGGQAP